MSFRSVIVLAVASLAIAAAAAAAPSSAAPASSHAPKPHSGAGAHRAWPGGHLPSHAKPPRAARLAAPARIPHLDPRLQAAPPSSDGTIEVTLHGAARALPGAVAKVGGRSIASAGDAVTAVVPRSALATLAGTPGMSSVDQPVRAYPDVISEGVAASKASVWQSVGQTGAGAKVGIVDVGFANLTTEIDAGRLPANTTVVDACASSAPPIDHGTAIAEIVHQMAPAAQLYLYCIADAVGFEQAEQQIAAAGDIKIVNSSLGFPGDSRGDGTGAPDSAATTVQKAQQAGILWIESAGNNGEDHWSGTLQDTDGDGWVDLNGTGCVTACKEADATFVAPGQDAQFVLKWDHWPTVSPAVPIALYAYGYQCTDAQCTNETQLNGGNPIIASQQAGDPPVLAIPVANQTAFDQEWDVFVHVDPTVPHVGYDLSYWGAVSQSYLSSVNPSRAAAGSITEPADSPSAFAVGAADVKHNNSLEVYSSQGPTIDGRVKPDITAFDDVSSNLSDLNPFLGTSASAPHVAGAAALVEGANPGWTAAQIQTFLQRRAGTSPPNNSVGYGVLNLGAPQYLTPSVTRLSSASGAVGTTVTISGQGLIAGRTTVKFGGAASRHVTVSSLTQLVASVPAASPANPVDVTVTTPGGTSALTSADKFTYRPLVAAAVDPRTKGYWLATPQGNVYQYGAPWYGSAAGVSLPAPVVGMAADPATGGYWLVTSKGNVYGFNAPFYGSMAGKALPAPVVSITSSGHGYLLTTKQGNVYNFNAPFYGSMAGKAFPGVISGVAPDPATGGYWLTTTKGNVYNFHAPWYGSAATTPLPAPVVTIGTSGAGYVLTTSAGNVLTFNTSYHGSPADQG